MSKLNEEILDVLDFLIQVAQETEELCLVKSSRDMLARGVLLRNYHQALRNIEECRPMEEWEKSTLFV